MLILGLTGSIGMGKSTAAAMLRQVGLPVHDADASVHQLMAAGGAAMPAVARLFPEAVEGEAVDRARLGRRVFGDAAALRQLEEILHPLVRRCADRFLRQQARRRQPVAVLDIPLLFETKAENRCDAVAVVSAPAWLQRQRVLARGGMTEERFSAILAQQMPDREKRRRADYVVETGLSKHNTLCQLRGVLSDLRGCRAHAWPPSARQHRVAEQLDRAERAHA